MYPRMDWRTGACVEEYNKFQRQQTRTMISVTDKLTQVSLWPSPLSSGATRTEEGT